MLKVCPECGRAVSEFAEMCPNCGLPVSLFDKANKLNKESSNQMVFIDLGLPSGTKWASCNVGAKSAYDVGQYFAWGDSQVKTNYSWENYKFFLLMGKDWIHDIARFSKYVGNSKMGIVDARRYLESCDDPATQLIGSNCCTPSYEQAKELHKYCQIRQSNTRGVSGYELIGPNGNNLFFINSGYMAGDKLFSPEEPHSWINWANENHHNAGCFSFMMNVGGATMATSWPNRCYGLPIRPVLKQY